MRYGRRCKVNSETVWVELDLDEVAKAVEDAIVFNIRIWDKCLVKIKQHYGVTTPEGLASVAMNPAMAKLINEDHTVLYVSCAMKTFTFIQQALERKINDLKVESQTAGK